jgi:hypothetical protein
MEAKLFASELNWILRNNKGFASWYNSHVAQQHFAERVWRRQRHRFHRHPLWEYGLNLVFGESLRKAIDHGLLEHDLLNLVFRALMRSEVRFSSRFVMQQSHEERLTGNLVSEMDAAIFHARNEIHHITQLAYGEPKAVEFYYYDLSRGGKLEKETGADLAFLVVVDLPDLPLRVATVRLQAKKIRRSAQIPLRQDSAYLFYDMDPDTLCAPIVVESTVLKSSAEIAQKEGNKSFSVGFDMAMRGTPLSLYLLLLAEGAPGVREHSSFEDAWGFLQAQAHEQRETHFAGRAAILSIGRSIQIRTGSEGELQVSV